MSWVLANARPPIACGITGVAIVQRPDHVLHLVIKYTTLWGRSHYEVLGSTATYTVFPQVSPTHNPAISAYCTCPAFTYAVLISESHMMVCVLPCPWLSLFWTGLKCKHILATRLAEQVGRCLVRPISTDDLALLIVRQSRNAWKAWSTPHEFRRYTSIGYMIKW